MTPNEAQARIDAIRADTSHPAHSLDATEAEAGAQELLALTRATLGPEGETVLAEHPFMVTPPTLAPSLPPAEQAVYQGMILDELAARAPALQGRLGVPIDAKNLRAFAAAMQPRPDTMPLRVEDALRTHPPAVRGELEYLHGLGWQALRDSGVFPFSAVVEGERGARFAPGFFEYVAEVGARVRAQRESRPRNKP
jgi:hypothetical protein